MLMLLLLLALLLFEVSFVQMVAAPSLCHWIRVIAGCINGGAKFLGAKPKG